MAEEEVRDVLTPERHQKTRRRSRIVYLALVPFALILFLLWLDLWIFHCQSAGLTSNGFKICRYAVVLPFVPLGIATGLAVLIALDLGAFADELQVAQDRRPRFVQGFARLDTRHKLHVSAALLLLVLGLVAIILFLVITLWIRGYSFA